MVCANAGYLLSHPSTGVRRADYFYSSTEKSSAQRFEIKTKNMGATPDKAVGVGSLTTRRTMKNHGRPYWKHYPSMAVLMQVPI